MVCRRRRVWALVSLAGMLWPAYALAATKPPKTADDMESAHGDAAVDIRDVDIAAAPKGSATDLAAYALAVADDFTRPNRGVNSTNPDARLNSAMLIAELKGLDNDAALEGMLKNSDASVRFWAARGLGDLASDLKGVGGGATGRAVTALQNAVKTEKSGVVIQEITKALATYGDPAAIRECLHTVIVQINANQPDVEMLHAAAAGLEALAPKVAGETAAEKTDSANLAMQLASLSAQQLVAYKATLDAASETLPRSYLDSTRDVADAASKVAAAAAGKTYPAPAGSSPDELLFQVNNLFGAPGAGGGTLQKDIPSLKAPPVVKSETASR